MNVKINLRDPNGAYADPGTGLAITGEGPLTVKLTKFVCGMIYRGEAEIYETTETLLESGEVTLDDLPWPKLKEYAISLGYDLKVGTKKEQLIDYVREKKDEKKEDAV